MKYGQMMVWLLTGLMAFAGVASAKSAKQAEAQRLEDEIRRHAQKNQWSGVERKYGDLMKLKKVTIKADTHVMAAQAAQSEADVDAWITRLERAGAAGADALRAVKRDYGKVVIKKHKGDALSYGAGMPFEPTKRKLIEAAAAKVKKKGKYKGWLPVGAYTVGARSFSVSAGQTVKVKK